MRCQQRIILPADKSDKFTSQTLLIRSLCRHIWGDGNSGNWLRTLIKGNFEHPNGKRTSTACLGDASVKQCHHCYMDFQIGIKSFGERGTALILTEWINLGAGFTPLDEKWQSHLIYGSARRFQPGVFSRVLKANRGHLLRSSLQRI
jgi:hypothetical protein